MAVIEYDNQKELMLSGEDKLTNVPQEFIIVTNMTDDTVYVSKDPDIADRLDDNEVMVVEPGCSGCNPNSWGLSDHCYFLGSGRVGIEFISNEHGGLCRALLLTAKSMNRRICWTTRIFTLIREDKAYIQGYRHILTPWTDGVSGNTTATITAQLQ